MANLTEITKENQRIFPESEGKYVLQTCKMNLTNILKINTRQILGNDSNFPCNARSSFMDNVRKALGNALARYKDYLSLLTSILNIVFLTHKRSIASLNS